MDARALSSFDADGGRAPQRWKSPDRMSNPLTPVPARSPPAAALVAGLAPFPVRRGGYDYAAGFSAAAAACIIDRMSSTSSALIVSGGMTRRTFCNDGMVISF